MNRLFLAFIGPIFLVIGCQSERTPIVSKTEEMMGTAVHVSIATSKNEKTQGAQSAMNEALEEIRKVENIFSLWIPESEVSRLNQEAWEKPVKVSPPMAQLLKASIKIARETHGAFDITILPLAQLWKEKMQQGSIPTREEIAQAKARVNFGNLSISRQDEVRFLRKSLALDFGAIAKGYAVDQAVHVLRKNGFRNFMVEAWGDIYVSGTFGKTRKWKVGIKHPRAENEVIRVLEVKDQALSTSGDYEQYLDRGKRRYHHIIDPRTGYPSRRCVSVTILAPTSTLADSYATAIFVLGPKKGSELIQRKPGFKAIIIFESKGKLKVIEVGK